MMEEIRKLDPLTLSLRGSQLIEASAGTGKTFTLALLYVRLVLGHRTVEEPLGEGIMPPNLLVVTFTEAATKTPGPDSRPPDRSSGVIRG